MWRCAKRFNAASVAFILFVPISVASASPQRSGRVTGRAVDEKGYVIPGATVTVENLKTGGSISVATDYGGSYRVDVEPGVYRVTLTHPGFKRYVRDGVRVEVGETVVVDLSVPYGETTDSVTVPEMSKKPEYLSPRERLSYLVGRWNVEGTYYGPWSDSPAEESIRGKASIAWDLKGAILSHLWEVHGESDETGERSIRVLLYWDSAKDRWKLFWFDDRNIVEQTEGFWKDKSLVFSSTQTSAEEVSIWITPQKESDTTWTLTVDVRMDGIVQPRFKARMRRE